MEVFFLPAISTLVCFVWYAVWLSAAVYIYSVGTPEPREDYPFITEIMWDENVRYILIYFFFCLLWVNAFIIGAVQFIIGASTCIWYFTVKTDTKGRGTLIHGVKWFFRYHWASIALGAMIIAICQFIRVCFEYFRKKMEGATGQNPFTKAILWCVSFFLACLEKCVKYVSKNAYIQIALTGDHFMQAAINAFCLILKNAHRFGMANTIGSVLMIFGCILITALSCFITYVYLTVYDTMFDITSPIPTTVCVGVIAVMIGYQFLSIFSFS